VFFLFFFPSKKKKKSTHSTVGGAAQGRADAPGGPGGLDERRDAR